MIQTEAPTATVDTMRSTEPEVSMRPFTSYWHDFPAITQEEDPRVLSAIQRNAQYIDNAHNRVVHNHFGGIRDLADWADQYYRRMGQHNLLADAKADLEKIGHIMSRRVERQDAAKHRREGHGAEPGDLLEAASVYLDLSRVPKTEPEERVDYRRKANDYLSSLVSNVKLSWTSSVKLNSAVLQSDINFDQLNDDYWNETIGTREYKEAYVAAQEHSITKFLEAASAFEAMPTTSFREMDERYEVFGLILEWAFIIDRRSLAYLKNQLGTTRVRHTTLRQDKGRDFYSGHDFPGNICDNFDVIIEDLDDDGQPAETRKIQIKLKGGKSKNYRAPIEVLRLHQDFKVLDVLGAIKREGRMFPNDNNRSTTPLAGAFVPLSNSA